MLASGRQRRPQTCSWFCFCVPEPLRHAVSTRHALPYGRWPLLPWQQRCSHLAGPWPLEPRASCLLLHSRPLTPALRPACWIVGSILGGGLAVGCFVWVGHVKRGRWERDNSLFSLQLLVQNTRTCVCAASHGSLVELREDFDPR